MISIDPDTTALTCLRPDTVLFLNLDNARIAQSCVRREVKVHSNLPIIAPPPCPGFIIENYCEILIPPGTTLSGDHCADIKDERYVTL